MAVKALSVSRGLFSCAERAEAVDLAGAVLSDVQTAAMKDIEKQIGPVPAGAIHDILKISRALLHRWLSLGVVDQHTSANGHGTKNLFSVRDMLILALVDELRKRGFSVPQAAAACRWIGRTPYRELRRAFFCSRVFLLAVGDKSIERFLFPAEIFFGAPDGLPEVFRTAAPIAIIDVRSIANQIEIALLARQRAEQDRAACQDHPDNLQRCRLAGEEEKQTSPA